MSDQTAMKIAAISLGCLMAFAGAWGGILLASLFTHKAGAGWGLPRLAMLSVCAAALLGALVGGLFTRHVSRLPLSPTPRAAKNL